MYYIDAWTGPFGFASRMHHGSCRYWGLLVEPQTNKMCTMVHVGIVWGLLTGPQTGCRTAPHLAPRGGGPCSPKVPCTSIVHTYLGLEGVPISLPVPAYVCPIWIREPLEFALSSGTSSLAHSNGHFCRFRAG